MNIVRKIGAKPRIAQRRQPHRTLRRLSPRSGLLEQRARQPRPALRCHWRLAPDGSGLVMDWASEPQGWQRVRATAPAMRRRTGAR